MIQKFEKSLEMDRLMPPKNPGTSLGSWLAPGMAP